MPCAAVACCGPDGSFTAVYPIVPTSTCSPAFAVTGIFIPTLGLGGSLIGDTDTWRTLNTLYYFIAAGAAPPCRSNLVCCKGHSHA